MSEEEKFKSIIQEIKDIYLYLTQGEPTPDDEIEAREKLVKMIQSLKTVDSPQVGLSIDLFEDTLIKLDNWDTLELWFIESELPEYIQKIISITDEIPEIQSGKEYEESPTTQIREDLEKASLDIDEIVGKVSEKFKGEIDGLKSEIDVLKLELEKKDETIKQVSQKKVIKKITPKKDVKLPPPKIKIPVIKTPKKPPQIKVPSKFKAEKPKEQFGIKSIEQVQAKIEEEIEKLKAPPFFEQKSKTEQEPIPESSELKTVSEIPKKPESILDILEESESPSQLPEPAKFTEMPEKPKKSTIISEIIEIETSEEEKEIPFALKAPKIMEKPEIMDKPEIIEKPKIILEKPKITSVSIEEIEAESARSSGTDLFKVFDSVGDKKFEKLPTLDESFSPLPVTEKKKKVDKKKKKVEKGEVKKTDTMSFIEFSSTPPEIGSIDESDISTLGELPSDKDSLYQELIALEGKRYSLEKSFKEIEKSYNTGSIDDFEYNKQKDELRGKLESITSRINKIRRVISSI